MIGLAIVLFITGSGTVLLARGLLFEVVVDVYPLVLPRNPLNTAFGFKNVSRYLFADDPTDATTAPETRTGRLTIFTTADGLQLDPEQAMRLIVPSDHTCLAKNELLSVGPILDGDHTVLYIVAHLNSVILLALLECSRIYGLQS